MPNRPVAAEIWEVLPNTLILCLVGLGWATLLAIPLGCLAVLKRGTWVDRAEAAAIRRATPSAVASSLYGHVAEHFSASPLLGVAAALLTGRLPRMLQPLRDLAAADGTEPAERFAAICTDFTGCVSGVLIEAERPINS